MINSRVKSFSLFQPRQGYHFSEDSLLLADSIHPAPFENILEFGGGCGVIPLLLAKKNPTLKIITLEIQRNLVECAIKYFEMNRLQSRIKVIHEDAHLFWKKFAKGSFQRIIANPPYRKIGKGRLNPQGEKAIARHEISLDLQSIIEWSACLLAPGGKLNFIFPSARSEEAMRDLKKNRFDLIEIEEIRRIRNSVKIFHARRLN